jgi:uncharacterized protein (DUF2252 family)
MGQNAAMATRADPPGQGLSTADSVADMRDELLAAIGAQPPLDLRSGRRPWRERRAEGKRLRAQAPRSSHGVWKPPSDRVDPVAQLGRANATREPALVPVRVARMVASPFAYYRGAADMMTLDLAPTPRSGTVAQICGDAHCLNFGFYGSPTGTVVFDVNDFDETAVGPWVWDVKRLAVSLVLAGRQNGCEADVCRGVVLAMVRAYRQVAASFARMGVLDLWRVVVNDGSPLVREVAADDPVFVRGFAAAQRHDNLATLPKLTEVVGGQRRFLFRPPLLTRLADEVADTVAKALEAYTLTMLADTRTLLAGYHVVDVAQKVVGVGSVGTQDFVVLLEGEGARDPLFLQMKQAVTSSVRLALAGAAPVHEGHRIVSGQRLMQAVSDQFLGWTSVRGVPFYVRQLKDLKGAMPLGTLKGQTLLDYGSLCAAILAKAHGRTGDPAVISGYCGRQSVLDHALADFAMTYADQVERDHAALVAAVKAGRILAAAESEPAEHADLLGWQDLEPAHRGDNS